METMTKTIEELQAENDALKIRTAELAGKIDALQTAGLQAVMEGVTPEIAEDVKWRVGIGLPLKHAVMAARSQLENDNRILEEEKA